MNMILKGGTVETVLEGRTHAYALLRDVMALLRGNAVKVRFKTKYEIAVIDTSNGDGPITPGPITGK